MTGDRWARLTWQATDPEDLARDIARRLGAQPVRVADGSWHFSLGEESLDIVPWRREGPDDEPIAEGRLMFEPIEGGGPVPEPVSDASISLVAVAWSTVELDRAEGELDPWLIVADPSRGDGDAHPDPHLGARTRLRRGTSLPGGTLVLAEPSTEGRLAGSLARDGEGPCALYLRPAGGLGAWAASARERGVRLSARRRGPLGTAILVPGRAIAGPHILVVDMVVGAPAMPGQPGTIAP